MERKYRLELVGSMDEINIFLSSRNMLMARQSSSGPCLDDEAGVCLNQPIYISSSGIKVELEALRLPRYRRRIVREEETDE